MSDKRYTPIRFRQNYDEMQFDIFQDGTPPAYRDVDGKLWMLAGHERVGHIGLMHSDDEGLHWTFDRWVLTDEQVCFSHHYNPNGDCALGQEGESLRMGAGDFSPYVEPNGEWMYIFYNVITINVIRGRKLGYALCGDLSRRQSKPYERY